MLPIPKEMVRIKIYCLEDLEQSISYNNDYITNSIYNLSEQDWETIATYEILSNDFIYTYRDKLNMSVVFDNQEISEKLIEMLSNEGCNLDWDGIWSGQDVSEKFIRKHMDKVNWEFISSFQDLSPEFVDEFQDKVNWEGIIHMTHMPNTLLDKYNHYFDSMLWQRMSSYQQLEEWFMEKYWDKLNIDDLSRHQKMSIEFIIKHANELNLLWLFHNGQIDNKELLNNQIEVLAKMRGFDIPQYYIYEWVK